MTLELYLTVALGGAFFVYFLGKLSSRLRDIFAVLVSLAVLVMTIYLYGRPLEKTFYFGFLNFPLVLRLTTLSWFFAITIAGIGFLSIIYSLNYMKNNDRLDSYYFLMLFINASMLGTVLCGDFLSFYIFWEMMSWSTYLLISYKGNRAIFAGFKYIIVSIIGSLSMLLAIVSLYIHYGTVDINGVAAAMQTASVGYTLFILILFSIAFVIINAFWPIHIWLPDAHAEAVTPFSSVLSAVLVRKGMYGLYLVMYIILGLNILNKLSVSLLSFNMVLCWIGAITIVFAAFTALLQEDSKRILAWSTVGQGGYMILGFAFGSTIGMAGATFHILNHCIYIALLFYVAGAIEYRTGGIRDLNKLGGLIKRMPITFIGGVVGIAGLVGLPLTNGFVSKWLIYKTLILGEHPFLAFAAFLGSWGTILYGYKFIHNIFLGQLPEEYKDIKEVPFSMQLPIILLIVMVFLFGILPGIPLKLINNIGVSLGFEPLTVNLWGITSENGVLNTLNLFFAVLVVGVFAWLLFRLGVKSRPVSQDDTYGAGSYIPEGKYHYTVNFYNPLSRIISPYLKDFMDVFYLKLARSLEILADKTRRVYTGDVGNYAMYIIFFLALLIFIQMGWKIW